MSKQFKGPLFIIGNPRSGTKLLMRIIQNHPKVFLTNEMSILPYLIRNKNIATNLQNRNEFRGFYNNITKSAYFVYKMKKGNLISMDEWYTACSSFNLEGVFNALVKYYTKSMGKNNVILGDKSPYYVKYVSELKEALPSSKFIHIVRDVRDASLSSYKVWKTNKIRYSQRWFNDINKAVNDLQQLNENDYIEIKYEELIKEPENTVKKCMEFLNIKFDKSLLKLKFPSENYGDAKGMLTIKKDNKQKYKEQISDREITLIESITFPLLKRYNYSYEFSGKQKIISKPIMEFYRFLDIINRLIFDIKDGDFKKISHILKFKLSFFKR